MTHTTPQIFQRFKNLVAAQSTRHGGVSPPPYESLNLGMNTTDAKSNILENRKIFFTNLGWEEKHSAGGHQVHGDKIKYVSEPGSFDDYDAFISNQKNILLTVTIADCVPILLYDSHHQAIAAIHAGWKGTIAEILKKTIKELTKSFNTNPADCFAYVGTCIDECSFEVDEDVAQHFHNDFKRWDEQKKKFFIDLKKANKQQLLDAGVPKNQIEISPYSTFIHNDKYFSYRKEKGTTGRMLAAIGLKE